MQKQTLGFVPRSDYIARTDGDDRSVLGKLSRDMRRRYEDTYTKVAGDTLQRKVRARDLTERAVTACDAFPQGTRVVVFGSSANGFGSPNSDLDMCLQLPQSSSLVDEEDLNGSLSMGKLAEILEETGMVDVNTDRLTARIPVVKFNCPMKTESGEEILIECDVSMQNPLACINTALLRTYSGIIPEVRILAAIIKQWAKSRDINNPADHTLSSYGYILMLLYFLTTHKATSRGDIVNVQNKDALQRSKDEVGLCTILPNLQWMDPTWLQSPQGTKFKELEEKPSNQFSTIFHPSEPSYKVNTYFFPLNDETTTTALQNHLAHRNQPRLSVGTLLASFFRYYAYEFDYKRHVVSLNATLRYGPIDRESKAETDGWKLYGQALCVEDPFESFYDVAHVLKPINFQRTRREFALAYAKISDAVVLGATDGGGGERGGEMDLLDRICEEISAGDS